MPDKKRRFRSKKDVKYHAQHQPNHGLVTLAKRDEEHSLVKPKILLKAPVRDLDICTSDDNLSAPLVPLKTMIINRTDSSNVASISPGASASCNVSVVGNTDVVATFNNVNANETATTQQWKPLTTANDSSNGVCNTLKDPQPPKQNISHTYKRESTPNEHEPVAQMTRPASIISANGVLNFNTRKLIHKQNTDFFVVGVLGTAGVGKTTIMNLLARDHLKPYDYYQKVFVEQDNIFPTKLKNVSRARTESTHMFINSERLILLDTPPMLLNSFRKNMVSNELDELQIAINLLNVCHLLVVVFNGSDINLDLVRTLRMAKHLKSRQLHQFCVKDYAPNLLFVCNRATRGDYAPSMQKKFDATMERLFGDDPNMNIYRGQGAKTTTTMSAMTATTITQQQTDPIATPIVNSFLIPEISCAEATSYHDSLLDIVTALRERVLSTPRKDIYKLGELNEMEWYELLVRSAQEGAQQFRESFIEVLDQNFELENNVSSSSNGGGNAIDIGGAATTTVHHDSRSSSVQRQHHEHERERHASNGSGGGHSVNWRDYNRTMDT